MRRHAEHQSYADTSPRHPTVTRSRLRPTGEQPPRLRATSTVSLVRANDALRCATNTGCWRKRVRRKMREARISIATVVAYRCGGEEAPEDPMREEGFGAGTEEDWTN